MKYAVYEQNDFDNIKFVNMNGQKYNKMLGTHQANGKLTMIGYHEPYTDCVGRDRLRLLCKCDCGRYVAVRADNFLREHTRSCGCNFFETRAKQFDRINTYDLSGEYGIGKTADGMEFYFDLDDYDLIKDYYWYHNNDGYIYTKYGIGLHRLVMNSKDYKVDKLVVDHINHVPYDCRKSNLRFLTMSENVKHRKTKED